MIRFLDRARKLPRQRKFAVCGGFLNTLSAWFLINFLPYKIWQRWLGTPVALSDLPEHTETLRSLKNDDLANIAWAHHALSRKCGKHFTCLMLGISARAMLRRRGYSSFLVLGANRGTSTAEAALGAHAWVICEKYEIAGGDKKGEYTAVAAFGGERRKPSVRLSNEGSS